MKTCSKCKEEKNPDCFAMARLSKDGLQPWCKACVRAYDKALKEELRGGPARKPWYTYTGEMVTCRKCGEQKTLTQNNFRSGGANGAHIRKTCKACDNRQRALSFREDQAAYVKQRLREYRTRDKAKGDENSLTFEFAYPLVLQPCVYCGDTEGFRGLDRIDGTKGHTPENVVPACSICNIVRRDIFTHEIMLSTIGPAVKEAREAGAIVGTGCAPRKY